VVSPKADGGRAYLGYRRGSAHGFLMDRAENITNCPWFTTPGDTILDVEVSNGRIWIFDAIVVNGHMVHDLAYHMRLAAAQSLLKTFLCERIVHKPKHVVFEIDTIAIRGPYSILVKPIWAVHNMQYAIEWQKEMKLETDGMVFTPLHACVPKYQSPHVFKWKPPELHTVDFLVRSGTLYVCDERGKIVSYEGRISQTLFENAIHECKWNVDHWVPVKLRGDKSTPNSKFVVERTRECIHENLQLIECRPRVV
jgi:hypothetical protein